MAFKASRDSNFPRKERSRKNASDRGSSTGRNPQSTRQERLVKGTRVHRRSGTKSRRTVVGKRR